MRVLTRNGVGSKKKASRESMCIKEGKKQIPITKAKEMGGHQI